MLKIKDDVDLKELEKYGFDVEKENYIYKVTNCANYKFDGLDLIIFEEKILTDLKTHHYFNFKDDSAYDTLYDLIKADLVEKVEE